MPSQRHILFATVALLTMAFGCASANITAREPKPNTGYVDFYSPTDAELCWDVRDGGASGRHFRTVFSEVKPVDGDVLRLGLAPGRHRLRVTFLNRVVKASAEIEVEIQNGKVIPVAVSLAAAGATTVLSKQTTMGGTPAGRGGRRTKINSEESAMFDISAVVESAVPYQPRQQMSYSH
jgi:hypothetical protein